MYSLSQFIPVYIFDEFLSKRMLELFNISLFQIVYIENTERTSSLLYFLLIPIIYNITQ